MTILFPQAGELIALKAMLNNTAGQDLTMKLFKSNTTPSNTDTAATYTECTFVGYASKALPGATTWTFTGGAPSSATAAAQVWIYTGNTVSDTIYGYFYVQTTSGILLAAERDPAPFTVANNGDQYQVTPAITAT